jgi:hypothetical protein
MKYQRKIGEWQVVVVCGEDLAGQADGLLTQIAAFNDKGPAIQDGTTIQFGWSLLTLRDNGGELFVCEPYFGGDPFQDSLPMVDDTLRVLSRQVGLLHKIGVEGADTRFSDKIAVARNCLKEEHIYLVRDHARNDTDSGWYIGKFGESEVEKSKDHIAIMHVFEVYNLRYSVMDVLTLPPGYKASYTGDLIEAVMAPNGTVLKID